MSKISYPIDPISTCLLLVFQLQCLSTLWLKPSDAGLFKRLEVESKQSALVKQVDRVAAIVIKEVNGCDLIKQYEQCELLIDI